MAGWLDQVLNVNRVQQRGNVDVPQVAFTGGTQEAQSGNNGWEQYHNGQGPNGLNAYPDEYSGHKLNMYM